MIITVGAGDIYRAGEMLLNEVTHSDHLPRIP